MRRSHEQSPAGRRVMPSVHPATSATSVARLLSLQATAGNRAVAALLEVQREPTPVEVLERTIADRITEARGRVTKGDIDAPAFEHYRTSTAGTVAAVAALLWQTELHFEDVDPAGAAIEKKADKKLVTDFKGFLEARVVKALTAKLRDL